jgi:hypothetical protein
MGFSSPFLQLPSKFDDFLYAIVCEDVEGTRVSVLSTLARRDVDPWDEAAHLAAMSTENAERTLALSLISGGITTPLEAKVIATRLVRLLPREDEDERIAAVTATTAGMQRKTSWFVWLCLAIGIWLLATLYNAAPSDTGISTTKPFEAPRVEGDANTMIQPSRS